LADLESQKTKPQNLQREVQDPKGELAKDDEENENLLNLIKSVQ